MAFAALCAERPGDRWPVLQAMVDAQTWMDDVMDRAATQASKADDGCSEPPPDEVKNLFE